MTSEKFCLRWNDFESNISVAFREIRDDKDFFDVTLACDDEQIQSHKMILSACSPFFRNILRRNPHQHPLIYLKGVKYTDLQAVLNFMYHGEVNVAQEELNSFLAVAEDLRVKGLTQNQTGSSTDKPESYSQPKASQLQKTNQQLHGQEALPPPKRQRPTPTAPTNTFTTTTSQFTAPSQSVDDDDIQEVVPVKTEPRDPPPPPASSVSQPSQDIYTAPASHSLAQVEDDSFGYQDDQYAEYDQYEDGQEYDGAFGAGDQTSYAAVEATKDAIFPSNWISCHQTGEVVLFPLATPNRRLERRMDIVQWLKDNFLVTRVTDLSPYQEIEKFLEGTGSIVFDHTARMAYACSSWRTDVDVLDWLCGEIGYTRLLVRAKDSQGRTIYHTNAFMSIAQDFVVICMDAVKKDKDKKKLEESFKKSGKKVIPVTLEQADSLAANCYEVVGGDGRRKLIISTRGWGSLTEVQRESLKAKVDIVQCKVDTIEVVGGGGIRCMLAPVFCERK